MARGAGHRSLLHGSFLARSADRTLSSLTSCSLDARLRCPVGLRAGGGTVGRFFPLAAFEYLLAAANSLAPRRSGILPALLGRRPCRRRVSYADVHVRALAIANCSVYCLSASADGIRTSSRTGSVGTFTQCSAAWLNLSLVLRVLRGGLSRACQCLRFQTPFLNEPRHSQNARELLAA